MHMPTDRKLVHIVDDEDSIRRSLDFLLSNSGYSVRRWCDAKSFLKGADKYVPACALIDVRMPEMDGLELQGEMQRQGYNFPIIVLSGHGSAIPGMPERMQTVLGLPISVARPPALAGYGDDVAARLTLPFGIALEG